MRSNDYRPIRLANSGRARRQDGQGDPAGHHRRQTAAGADLANHVVLDHGGWRDGLAVFEGEPRQHPLNPMGGVHGGWALPLIDSVGGCAGHSLPPAG
jgi:acyl-coenzyme A thioesterase PaaI-like protein